MNHKLRLSMAAALAMVLGSYWFAATAEASGGGDISKINGSIRVSSEQEVEDASTVNGSIRIEQGASAGEISTINGAIRIADAAVIEQAQTVNGGIRVGENVTVEDSLESVNGSIRTGSGTTIERDVKTVHGKIELQATRVGHDLVTRNGDIELRDGTVIEGNVEVKQRHRSWWSRLFSDNHNTPEIYVDSTSRIHGDIHLYREVELRLDEDVVIGEIIHHY